MTHTVLLIATAIAALAAISIVLPFNRRRRHRLRRLAFDATRRTDPDHGVFA